MLIRLFADNYGVFRDGFDLSLEAMKLGSDSDRGYFRILVRGEDEPLELLRVAAIYGPNASGKSTVVHAARTLSSLVVDSAPKSQEGQPIHHYNPFEFGREHWGKPCTLGCEVTVHDEQDTESGGCRVFVYEISFTVERITHEKITERGRQQDIVWIERTDDSIDVPSESPLHHEEMLDLSKVTRSNAATISVAAQLGQKPLLGIFSAVRDAVRVLYANDGGMASMDYTVRRLHKSPSFRSWTLDRLLREADLGITDIHTEQRKLPEEAIERLRLIKDEDQIESVRNRLEPVCLHLGADGEHPLDFSKESAGTQKMLALAGPWYDVIHRRLTLFVDELSSSLHPSLLMALLEAFNASPDKPPSQLVFTAHDPSPLEGTLRRDQVYFTEKDVRGAGRLYPLSDFKDRNVHNIRKRYLEGRYGALPRDPGFGSMFEPAEADD